jgi:hypothetical protein
MKEWYAESFIFKYIFCEKGVRLAGNIIAVGGMILAF